MFTLNRRQAILGSLAALFVPKPAHPWDCVGRGIKVIENGVKSKYNPYISEEALADIRPWGVDYISENTRREIYSSGWAG